MNLGEAVRIGAHTILPAERRDIVLQTADGFALVGDVALPPDGRPPAATLILLHPLPTQGGNMDSHLFRKATWRLPALADLAVIRLNTRGTTSARGRSEGTFTDGPAERADILAAIAWAQAAGLPKIWLVGWSFGAEIAIMHAAHLPVEGVIALAPPLIRATSQHLVQWAASRKPLYAIVPENDDFLPPRPARDRFAMTPHAKVIEAPGCGHLWVGEKAVQLVLDHIVQIVRPGFGPLPTTWHGPYSTYRAKEA
ncbi:MAG: alpha/beta fold hydrolase [Bifidobacteriaceae bacterium]|nr:alpha/beta fold hydrolase [Bifidobacteriaceae bacterium]